MEGLCNPLHYAGHHTPQGKGLNMAEQQETQQEQEDRWNAHRTARNKLFQELKQGRRKKAQRIWLIVAVIVLIIVVAAVVLL
jgi:lipopolysaccharide/colanic/teichoic acid biosynthesis glycosyltransferase